MKKRKRFALTLGAAIGLSLLTSIPAFAGEWKQDNTGWWWQENDGTYPTNTWCWLDGNQDGISECYYFNEAGYLLTNTFTPDGYWVNGYGAWIDNGAIQGKSSIVGVPYKNQLAQFLAGTYQFQTVDIHNPGDPFTVTGNVRDEYENDGLGMSWSGMPIELDNYYIFKNVMITCSYWNIDPENIYPISELYIRKDGTYTYITASNGEDTTTYTLKEFLNRSPESHGRWGLRFDSEGYVIALSDGEVG